MQAKDYIDQQVVFSSRLVRATNDYGLPLEEGLELLNQNFHLFRPENVGVGERTVFRSFRLRGREIDLLEDLKQKVGSRPHLSIQPEYATSMLFRAAVELLIHKYQIRDCYKPEGWRSRPLGLRQGGANPMQLEEPTYGTTAKFPLILWADCRHLIRHVPTYNLSGFCRSAIDACNVDSLNHFHIPILQDRRLIAGATLSIRPFERQRAFLEELSKDEAFGSVSAALTAIVNQALRSNLVEWAWDGAELAPYDPQAEQLYHMACQSGIDKVALLQGKSPEQVIQLLRDRGYLCYP